MESWELLKKKIILASSLLELLQLKVVDHQVHVLATRKILGLQRCPSELRGAELSL